MEKEVLADGFLVVITQIRKGEGLFMKKLLSMALVLVLVLSCFSIVSAEEKIVVNFWHSFGSGANLECIDQIIADFNAMQDKYEVVGTFQGNYAEILGKLTVAYAAGDVPAVSFVDSVDCPQLTDMGMLTNLSQYAAENDPDYDFSVFVDGLMNYGTGADGNYYALPFGRSTPLMYVNMDIVKEATGEEIIPQTREEFVRVLEAVRDNTDYNPFSCPLVCWYFANFLTSSGHGFMSKDGLSSYFAIDEGGLASFTFWKWLSDEGLYVAPPVGNAAWVGEEFTAGNTAFVFDSTGTLTAKLRDSAFDLRAGFLPADEIYCVQTGGCNMVFPNKAKAEETAGAWAFATYATSLEVNAYVNEATGYMLSHKDSYTLESVQKLWEEKPLYKVAYDQLQYVNDVYVSSYFAELNLEVVNLLSSLLQDNQITAQDAYDQLLIICENLLPNGNATEYID